MGGRQGACLAATGSWTACSRRSIDAELRRLKTVPGLGPAPRRSALRENRRLTRAESDGQITFKCLAVDSTARVELGVTLSASKVWRVYSKNHLLKFRQRLLWLSFCKSAPDCIHEINCLNAHRRSRLKSRCFKNERY